MDELGNFEVEAWIVDKDDNIGLPLGNILLTHLHILEDGTQVDQDGDETHVGQLAIVTNTRASDGSHQVASEETKLSLSVTLLQSLHQM